MWVQQYWWDNNSGLCPQGGKDSNQQSHSCSTQKAGLHKSLRFRSRDQSIAHYKHTVLPANQNHQNTTFEHI